jgi:hypothetical protein
MSREQVSMKSKFQVGLLLLTLLLSAQKASADDLMGAWNVRDVQGVTEKDIEAARRLGVADVEKRNLKVASWADAFLTMVGANQHKGDKVLLSALIAQLTDKTKTDLKNTSRLIIWERVTTGEILFDPMGGYQINDDLFTVAGRANWMLRSSTKKNFGYVKPNTSAEELTKLQQKWSRWLQGEQIEEHSDEYVLTKNRSNELKKGLNSLEALEGLITSLKPHSSKEKRRAECVNTLRSVYGANSSTSTFDVCKPDLITQTYIYLITGIKSRHDYDWWKRWLDTNKSQLVWNKEKEIFEVKR